MSDDKTDLLRQLVDFTKSYETSGDTVTMIRLFAATKGISLEDDVPAKLPEELIDRATIKNMPIGFEGYTVPWAMIVLDNGEMWISGDFTVSQQPGGTVTMHIRRVDGGVQVNRQTMRPMRYKGVKTGIERMLPVVAIFNDEKKRPVHWY